MKSLEYERTTTLPFGLQVFLVVCCGVALSWLAVNVSTLILVVALIGIAYCIMFLQRPDLGILLTLVVRPVADVAIWLMGYVTTLGPAAALTPNAGLIIVLVGCGVVFMLARRVPVLSLPGGVLLVLFLLAGSVALLRAESKIGGLMGWLSVASLLVVYALVAHLFRTAEQIQRVIDVLAISFVIPASFGLYQLAYHLNRLGGFRVYGTFVHGPAFSLFLVLIVGIAAGQFLSHSGVRKFLALVILATSGGLLIATFTRGGWAGALAALFVLAILSKRLVMALVLIAVVFTTPMLVPAVSARLAQVGEGTSTLSDRLALWQLTLQEWTVETTEVDSSIATTVNRVLGLGPKQQMLLTGRSAYGESGVAHDDYVRILVDYGILGLVLYLLLTFVVTFFAYQTWRRCTDKRMRAVPMSLVALSIGYSIQSLTDNVFGTTYVQIPLWTLAGLTVAIARLQASTPERCATGSATDTPRMPGLSAEERLAAHD